MAEPNEDREEDETKPDVGKLPGPETSEVQRRWARTWLSAMSKSTVPAALRDDALLPDHWRLEEDIRELKMFLAKSKLGDLADKAALREKNTELQEKLQLDFLLSRVSEVAGKKLLSDLDFRNLFLEQSECEAFVVSVDIRRSTELMLKAKNPERFAAFISELCAEFLGIITRNFGVFDKFTGDGILAFFPKFFSGEDAGLLALKASIECHEAFERHYRGNRSSFTSILTSVGLGIGVDFGVVHLVKMPGSLTVVGVPVVYACRLGGAPAKETYLNQPAFDEVSSTIGAAATLVEAVLELKHEGEILAYRVCPSGLPLSIRTPQWVDR